MAYLFGFEVNLLELLLLFEVILLFGLGALLYELRRLKNLVDEVMEIEKIHSREEKKAS